MSDNKSHRERAENVLTHMSNLLWAEWGHQLDDVVGRGQFGVIMTRSFEDWLTEVFAAAAGET